MWFSVTKKMSIGTKTGRTQHQVSKMWSKPIFKLGYLGWLFQSVDYQSIWMGLILYSHFIFIKHMFIRTKFNIRDLLVTEILIARINSHEVTSLWKLSINNLQHKKYVNLLQLASWNSISRLWVKVNGHERSNAILHGISRQK